MDFKGLRAGMTEPALSVEYAMRGSGWVGVHSLAIASQQTDVAVEFILTQMVISGIACMNRHGQYSLTPEYKATGL